MIKLSEYNKDGAGNQAQAVLAYIHPDIEESWNVVNGGYDAVIEVSRWENCREQGYVLSMRNKSGKQLNIIFFEHRNSDGICAVKWIQNTINAPTIDNAEFGDVYQDKYDVSHSVNYGQAESMAKWIESELTKHYN